MDRDDERDEAIAEARISGTSSRALAKRYGCTNREIEEAIDSRLSYELDQRQKLRLVKLSIGRIESLMASFYERAVKDKDVAAGTLCCKLEERLAALLGLDNPVTQRVDVYAVEAQRQPSQHDQIRAAIFELAGRDAPNDIDGNGVAVAPPMAPDSDLPGDEGNGSEPPRGT